MVSALSVPTWQAILQKWMLTFCLLIDSLIPEYGSNSFNISDIREQVRLNIADIHKDAWQTFLGW
jgi:hypothetical protein